LSLVDRFIQRYSRLPTERDPDYLEMLRMSKYTIEDVPYFIPGKCCNCGASKNDGRRYINIGLELEWYGFVYFCGECLKDIANTFGLFDDLNELATKKDERIKDLESKLEQGVELPESLVKSWEEFKEYYASVHPVRDYVPPNTSSVLEPDTSESKPGTNQTESTTPRPKSRATKSATSSGRSDVRSLAELLEDAASNER
jgi:hypothetical protein